MSNALISVISDGSRDKRKHTYTHSTCKTYIYITYTDISAIHTHTRKIINENSGWWSRAIKVFLFFLFIFSRMNVHYFLCKREKEFYRSSRGRTFQCGEVLGLELIYIFSRGFEEFWSLVSRVLWKLPDLVKMPIPLFPSQVDFPQGVSEISFCVRASGSKLGAQKIFTNDWVKPQGGDRLNNYRVIRSEILLFPPNC